MTPIGCPSGSKSYKVEKYEMLVQLNIVPDWTSIGDDWTHNGLIEKLQVPALKKKLGVFGKLDFMKSAVPYRK
ncbi:hypothetical protein TNCV_4890061 [Trichonephila clavipes]|nr:hypothetical protein TNCV_4890061 [Trichonephila clavipes]